MSRAKIVAGTLWRLGLRNLIRLARYRGGLKSGLHPVFRAEPKKAGGGRFFATTKRSSTGLVPTKIWQGQPWAFGRAVAGSSQSPPDWHANLLTGTPISTPNKRWDYVSTFESGVGDIKTVWEASRFDWLLAFAQASVAGDPVATERIELWLKDWQCRNPAYLGPNWMCAQEASIRVAHLAVASILLGHDAKLTPALAAMLITHLRRIFPTIGYSRAQDNNHGTSEAMALYVGGTWLARSGTDELRREGLRYGNAGRKLLEERIQRLVFADGGFSQYSIVYHRLMLDSLSVVECWRRRIDDEEFSDVFKERASAASRWLARLIEPETGDAPNYGSNDGAWLLPLGRGEFRDFRPSAALASTLFEHATRYAGNAPAKDILAWMNVPEVDGFPSSLDGTTVLHQSGLVIRRDAGRMLLMRLPGTRFRPSQSDALHLDLWIGRKNVLRDAGTYSYVQRPSQGKGWEYFPSIGAHNSVAFDERDHMPRLGRFLYGGWLRRGAVSVTEDVITADVRTFYGMSHTRRIFFEGDVILVEDQIEGTFERAILRWRLQPEEFHTLPTGVESACLAITSEAHGAALEYAVESGLESRFFLEAQPLPVLAVTARQPCTIRTAIRCKSSFAGTDDGHIGQNGYSRP